MLMINLITPMKLTLDNFNIYNVTSLNATNPNYPNDLVFRPETSTHIIFETLDFIIYVTKKIDIFYNYIILSFHFIYEILS